jgi:dimethylamine/trimethylamine dehydrogenase
MLDLRRLGVEVLTCTAVTDTRDGAVIVSDVDGAERPLAADTVVLVGQRESSTGLYRSLQQRRSEWDAAGVQGVFRIGDCERPMFIADAIFSGHRLAREIDSTDPAQPLPWVRERRIVGGTDADFLPGATSTSPVH